METVNLGTIAFELALILYFAASTAGFAGLLKGARSATWLMFFLAGVGFFAHTVSIIQRYVFAGQIPISSPYEAASFFAWCIVLLFFILEMSWKIRLLGSFIVPIAFLLLTAASMLPRDIKPLSPALQSNWLAVHTAFAFLGNAAFALAFGVGIMYLVQEHFLKSKHLGDMFGRLPSIHALDLLNYRLITIGFPLLTVAIITGAVWAESAWGSYWDWDAREVWSLATWLIYAIILHTRLISGWRGRRAAVLSIIGFVSILAAFFGIKLLDKGMHVF